MAFEHITLNTGDSLTRDNTVELVAVEVIKPIVADLIQPDGEDRDLKVALPGFESYRVKGRCCKAGYACFTVYKEGEPPGPLVDFGVAVGNDEAARDVWECLRGFAKSGHVGLVSGETVPEAPWCAVVLHVGLGAIPKTEVSWLDDFQRYVTCAMLDMHADGQWKQ